ncbi:MAG: hypothetical protein ACI9QL_005023 [Candidatus Omnitrophota bacterium]|jgi:hypothetical protein
MVSNFGMMTFWFLGSFKGFYFLSLYKRYKQYILGLSKVLKHTIKIFACRYREQQLIPTSTPEGTTMKNLTKVLALTFIGGLVSLSTAQAEEGERKAPRGGRGGPEMHKKMLEKFDADKDGKLNEDERAKAREEMAKHRGGPGGPGGRGPSPEMKKKLLAEFDADKDGKLNEDERAKARAAMKERHGDRPGGPGARDGKKPEHKGEGKKPEHRKGDKKGGDPEAL